MISIGKWEIRGYFNLIIMWLNIIMLKLTSDIYYAISAIIFVIFMILCFILSWRDEN